MHSVACMPSQGVQSFRRWTRSPDVKRFFVLLYVGALSATATSPRSVGQRASAHIDVAGYARIATNNASHPLVANDVAVHEDRVAPSKADNVTRRNDQRQVLQPALMRRAPGTGNDVVVRAAAVPNASLLAQTERKASMTKLLSAGRRRRTSSHRYCPSGHWSTAKQQNLKGDARFRCTAEGAKVITVDGEEERLIKVGSICHVQCDKSSSLQPVVREIPCILHRGTDDATGQTVLTEKFEVDPKCELHDNVFLKIMGVCVVIGAGVTACASYSAAQQAKQRQEDTEDLVD
eukprot:TRINITY_DN123255_c0_g1_i1.p1 TRINITY_DN123255_c0_g1~~TRINITY_DN123255_c0_g1_i1.p1  ORF type:complete len:291 (+),score=42.22 TRINITY_DN123255_c0_g1_i1:83-955(+)